MPGFRISYIKLHKNEQTQLVQHGHSHHAYVSQARGRLVVNCGSFGLPFDRDNRASYANVEFNNKDLAVQLRRHSGLLDILMILLKTLLS
ncbi:metallophosphoesterase family protein [Paenibacillus silviterrae]|uniref:metallophosphoesterase family protein n=1 Tax=Paenibacillus silviterrae TaxID=3242194 RepID=UPI0025432E65|nr:metallophosphoesterase family protein [Paenibacillus chinjuensis]